MAESSDYDLVLSDLGMPDMSGWEVADRITRRDSSVPVVLVTGWGTTISEDEIARSSVCAVVHKPFEPFAVRDGNLITGQQQHSGAAAAELVIQALGR